jgi:hypothetical protein
MALPEGAVRLYLTKGCDDCEGVISVLTIFQIVLRDEDGLVLGSRYLKSGESIESGTRCQFPNYIIEVTALRNQKNG